MITMGGGLEHLTLTSVSVNLNNFPLLVCVFAVADENFIFQIC